MDLNQMFRRLVYAQVLVALVASCMAERSPLLLLFAGGLWAVSWYVVESPVPETSGLPRWLILLAEILVLANLPFEIYKIRGQDLITPIAHFTMWLQIVLLFGHKTNREYAPILVLSLLQMISASVISVSVIFALLLFAYCVLALFTVLLFTLKISSDVVCEQNQHAAAPGQRVSPPKAVIGRGYRWQFRLTTLGIGLSCATIAVVTFMLLPRTDQKNLFPALTPAYARQTTGFSPTVTLRGAPLSGGNRQAVLNLQITSDQAFDPERESWLLRGAVLDRYEPTTWTWSSTIQSNQFSKASIDLPPGGMTLLDEPHLPRQMPRVNAHITLLHPAYRSLFVLHPVSHIDSDSMSAVTFNIHDQQLTMLGAMTGPVAYEVRAPLLQPEKLNLTEGYSAALRPRHGRTTSPYYLPRSPARTAPLRHYARGWPVHSDRVRQYTRQILEPARFERDPGTRHHPDDQRICHLLVEHLRDPGIFRYSLDVVPTPKGRDPIIDFLFTHRRGHCELFASGLAAMTRSIGMRARVITGYRASEFSRIGRYYVVRENHAHAWTEVEVGPSNWRTFDASPPASVARLHQADNSWLTALRHMYEHLEFAWANSVLAYNQDARAETLETLGQSIREAAESRASWFRRTLQWIGSYYNLLRRDRMSHVLAGVIVFFIMVGLVSLLRTLIVRRRRLVALQLTCLPHGQRKMLARQLRFYLTMLDMLERQGHVRPSWQSPFGFAQELAARQPVRFAPVVALTEIFYEIRFGYRRLDEERRLQIRNRLREMDRTLRQKAV